MTALTAHPAAGPDCYTVRAESLRTGDELHTPAGRLTVERVAPAAVRGAAVRLRDEAGTIRAGYVRLRPDLA